MKPLSGISCGTSTYTIDVYTYVYVCVLHTCKFIVQSKMAAADTCTWTAQKKNEENNKNNDNKK